MNERRLLTIILALFVFLGAIYALTTPVFEASDELWHYPMVKHLADGNPLPAQVFDPDQAGPWKQEASQPPLYYYLGAALTFWIDTSDMPQVRNLNPHVDNGVLTEDGNINLVIHEPGPDPLRGTILAIRLVRLLSVLLGACTVYLTYLIASEAVPERPAIALGAAAVNAFTPMFLFISGAVNNDNLVIPLASLALYLMIRLVRDDLAESGSEFRRLLLLGAVIGMGALSKITALGLLPLAGGAIWLRHWRLGAVSAAWPGVFSVTRKTAVRFILLLLPAAAVAGWWYVRNVQLYGDWSGWNAFIAVLGQRAHPASLAQLWDERWGFLTSYWGLFGGLNVAMPRWIYWALNLAMTMGVIGFAVYVVRLLSARRKTLFDRQKWAAGLLDLAVEQIGLVICLLWSAAVFIGLVRWATVTWSSQGRLVFSAISALSTMLVVGLAAWLRPRQRLLVVAGLGSFMLAISAIAPFLWIGPAYRAKDAPIDAASFRVANEDFGGQMLLSGYSFSPEEIRPGGSVDVRLRWKALVPMERDWSVFLHLVDPALEAPIAQRDMYPGGGLVATGQMTTGQELVDYYRIQTPRSLYAPATLELVVGLYDFQTGERLATEAGKEGLRLGPVKLLEAAGELPNPTSVDFEGQLELLGYMLAPRRTERGGQMELVTYWRAQRPLDLDYTLFAQILDEDTTRWASQDLAQPTSRWLTGEVQEVTFMLKLAADAPSAVYPLIVGAYLRPAEGSYERLQTVTPEGRLTDDFWRLTVVRVD